MNMDALLQEQLEALLEEGRKVEIPIDDYSLPPQQDPIPVRLGRLLHELGYRESSENHFVRGTAEVVLKEYLSVRANIHQEFTPFRITAPFVKRDAEGWWVSTSYPSEFIAAMRDYLDTL